LLDQLTRRLEQHFAEIAVVIGARAAPVRLVVAHVKGFYIKAVRVATRASSLPFRGGWRVAGGDTPGGVVSGGEGIQDRLQDALHLPVDLIVPKAEDPIACLF
jgi:hypothetical protein